MEPVTLNRLTTELVRLAEQFPDRVGIQGHYWKGNEHCMLGHALENIAGCRKPQVLWADNPAPFQPLINPARIQLYLLYECRDTMTNIAHLNDYQRQSYSQIVKALGLVPGEQLPEIQVRQDEEVLQEA